MVCKKFDLTKLFLPLILFLSTFLSGCDVLWFGNFGNDLKEQGATKFRLFSDKEGAGVDPVYSTTRYYKNGVQFSASDLPGSNDSEIASWKPGAKISGWHYYRTGEGINVESQGAVTSFIPQGLSQDFYALWHYPYKVKYYYEDLTGNMEFKNEVTMWGEDGSLIEVYPEVVTGFDFGVDTGVYISSTDIKTVDVTYTRKLIRVTFDANGGSFSDSTSSHQDFYKYGTHLDPYEEPVKPGYAFVKWTPDFNDTVPAENITYTAVWEDCEFALSYADWNAGLPAAKTCSADVTDLSHPLPDKYILGAETELPDPITTAAIEDTIEFAGYFYDADCTNSLSKNASGKYYLKTTDSGDKRIYLKWKYKVVYVDPASGDDTNTGHNATNAVKTVYEAKKYLACGQDDSTLVLCSTLSDAAQISALSGISTTPYHNAKIVNSSSFIGSLIKISDNVTLKNLVIESDSFAAAVTVSNGLLTVDNLTVNNGVSYEGISLNNNGSLLISGIYNYNSTSDSSSPVQINIGCTGSLYMSGSGKINSSNPVILQNGQKITISGPLTQSGIVATIYSAAPSAAPVVLTDSIGGSHVSSYYKKFASANPGYTINSAGQLVTASGIDLNPIEPVITEYDPGNLASTVVTKVSGGDTFVTFNVTDTAYEKIAAWGTDKYIQYTIDGSYGNIAITGSAGNYTAVLNLTSLRSGTDATVTPVNLMPGLHSLVIYAEAQDPLSDVITTEEYQIFVK